MIKRYYLLFPDEMQREKEALIGFKNLLLEIQKLLLNESNMKAIAELLSLTIQSVYSRRNDPTKLTLNELRKLADYYSLDRSIIDDYEKLLYSLNTLIKASGWVKSKLMERLNIKEARSARVTRKPETWQLQEVEGLFRLLEVL